MDNEKEISFGAFDSELMHQEIFIPEGFTATIDGNKIILKKIESEDERIRKELIEHVKDQQSSFISAPDCRDKYEEEENNKYNSWLSWLEKQGEQKPADKVDDSKVEPKFKVGDWIINRTDATIMQIINNKDFYESVEIGGQRRTDTYNYVEWDFRIWTIKDAKDGDVLADDKIDGYLSPFVALYKKIDEECDFESYCFVGFDGKFYKGENGHSTEEIHPATKEQRDILFAKIKEAGYEWDENNKMLKEIVEDEEEPQNYKNQIMSEITDLVKHYIKQKPTCGEAGEDMKEALRTEYEKGRADAFSLMQKIWSEKDEKILKEIISDVKFEGYNNDMLANSYKKINFLKSLKQRYAWKPSDEQIVVLELASKYERVFTPKQIDILIGLKEQLKKLKGE